MTHSFSCLLTEASEVPSLKSCQYSVLSDSQAALLQGNVSVAVLACSLLEADALATGFFLSLHFNYL